jgi:hypothetical protein
MRISLDLQENEIKTLAEFAGKLSGKRVQEDIKLPICILANQIAGFGLETL